MSSRVAFSFNLVGLKEMMDALEQLPTIAMQKGVLRRSLITAGAPIVEAAKGNVPVKSGRLRDSIKVSTSLKATQRRGRFDRSAVTVYVGSSSPLAHLIEFGTTERILKKPRTVNLGGDMVQITNTGHTPANPFMRQAWDSTKDQALKIFGDEIWTELVKTARRLAKRAAKGTLGKRQIEGLR